MKAVQTLKHFENPTQPGSYARLVCLKGKNKGLAYVMKDKRIVMGRSDKADIRVLDIKSSREHCEITLVGGEYVLTDLGSQNGTVVNDLTVKQHILNKNDKVIIGESVYRFETFSVKDEKNNTSLEAMDEDEDEGDVDEEVVKSKLTPILMIVAVIAGAMLFLSDDSSDIKNKKRKKSKFNINEVQGSVVDMIKTPKNKDKELSEKVNLYIQKGLREFREGNYFRAMSEFEHALSWSPNDAQASFYLSKTKEALDRTIKNYFLKAKRDEESLKYQSALVSYCGIIRLLYRYPEDQRYKDAKEFIAKAEEILGYEEGQVECAKEIK